MPATTPPNPWKLDTPDGVLIIRQLEGLRPDELRFCDQLGRILPVGNDGRPLKPELMAAIGISPETAQIWWKAMQR